MLKYSVSFSLHKRNAKLDVTAFPVRMRVSFDGKRPDFYTGITIDEYLWNPKTQRSYEKKSLVNKEIENLENLIDDIFEKFEYELKRFPTIEELRRAFKIATNKSPEEKDAGITVLDLFEIYSENVGTLKQWSDSRYQKYNQLKNHWEIYNDNILLNKLSEDDIIGFIRYLQTSPLDYKTRKLKTPHRNTTVAKEIKDFMSMISWASKKEIYTGKLHTTFEPIFKGSDYGLKDLVFLSWDELIKLYHYEFNTDRLNRVRDMFCFQCFTGLRFSDLDALKKSQIKDGYFIFATEKTIDPLKIELNNYSFEIVKKYIRNDREDGRLFPVISGQKYNDYIKEIAKILEFDEQINEIFYIGNKRYQTTYIKYDVISSHAGRRTFIINGIALGIPSEVIRKWTGHKNEQAMKPYIKIIDSLKEEEMKKFNRR